MRQVTIRSGAAALAAGLLGGVLLASTAQAGLFVSEKEIEREARVQWLMMKKHLPPAPDARVQAYVECITNDIIDVLDPSFGDLPWEIRVFDDETMNAFAMPGGKVGVFTGILRVADTPDALAAVIGHEIAHLTSDHVMERAKRQSRGDALAILGGAVAGTDIARTATALLWNLPYSRKQESEADVVGLEYMAKAGFDPRATIYLWKNMSAANENKPPEFLSTHPGDDRRLDDLIKNLTPALVQYNAAREAGKRPACQL
ncbi:MAG TPA: M48 family metallopeptidase [Gammaproteobacteria bacterium]